MPDAGVPADGRVMLWSVPWATYVGFRDAIESAAVRMTYLDGALEIARTSVRHEVTKKQISRLLELFAVERDIPLWALGSPTLRDEGGRRGLEPDQAYSRGGNRMPPDLVIDVMVANATIDKLEVYRGLGVSEIWSYAGGAFKVLALVAGACHPIEASRIMPEVDLALIARFVEREDHPAAMREFRDLLLA